MKSEAAPTDEVGTAPDVPREESGDRSTKKQQRSQDGELETFLKGHRARLKAHGDFQLVAIDPTGAAAVKTHLVKCVAEASAWAKQENEAGRNIYYQPNPVRPGLESKAKKTDIAAALFCQVDIDPPKDGSPFDVEQMGNRLAALAAPPTIIIASGNGVQALWALQEACHAV